MTSAKNGKEGVALLATNESWDLVLLDFATPETTDLDVLAYLRKSRPTMPAIIMSGMVHQGLPDWMAVGAVASIAKPFHFPVLCKLIQEIEESTTR